MRRKVHEDPLWPWAPFQSRSSQLCPSSNRASPGLRIWAPCSFLDPSADSRLRSQSRTGIRNRYFGVL